MKVGDGEILVILVFAVDINNLAEDAHGSTQILGILRRTLNGDADDDVGPHLTGDVGRIVVAQATVNQHLIANPDRRESCRNGH